MISLFVSFVVLSAVITILKVGYKLNNRTRHPSSMVSFSLLVILAISLIIVGLFSNSVIALAAQIFALVVTSYIPDKIINQLADKCNNIYPFF